LPPGAGGPGQPKPKPDHPDCNSCKESGSIIEVQNQALGEAVPITGTPFSLYYTSDRTPGRVAANQIVIPLSGTAVPASLKRIDLEILVAGQDFTQSFPAAPGQSYTFSWDGKDAYGHAVQGSQPITVRVGYVYPAVYLQPDEAEKSFGGVAGQPITGSEARQEITVWQVSEDTIGAFDARALGLGGWSLSVQHAYDPVGRVLYRGDGVRLSTEAASPVITTVAGGGLTNNLGDGGPATQASFLSYGVAVGPDGSLYIADSDNDRIRRVDPNGIITTVAGSGDVGGFGGDGGPATQAQLNGPLDVALGPDGSLYIADSKNIRVRRVGPDGVITTVAGNGLFGTDGDGGPATQASLRNIERVAVGPDGSLYIADNTARLRRVGPDGIITTVAGNGIYGDFTGDGGLATQAQLGTARGVAAGPDGSLYIAAVAANQGFRIRRVGPDGIITTVAGSDDPGLQASGDGGPATQATLGVVPDVAVGPDGSLYLSGQYGAFSLRRVAPDGIITTVAGNGSSFSNNLGDGGPATQAQLRPYGVAPGPDGSLFITDGSRVRRVAPALPGLQVGDSVIPSEDGREVYLFNSSGRLRKILDPLTGAPHYEFQYDAAARLTQVIDKRATTNNVTTIQYDALGNPTAIVAPFGQETDLTVQPDGYLASVKNPAGATTSFTYNSGTAEGLLASLTTPVGATSHFEYDAQGRLTKDTEPAGDFKALSRTDQADGWTVTQSTPLAVTTVHQVENLPGGEAKETHTAASGLQTVTQIDSNGTRTVTYPDQVTVKQVGGPDPRFGMAEPLPTSLTVTTPGGKQLDVTTSRSVTLADPNDVTSLQSQTDNLTLNGATFTSTFDAASQTITHSTPLQRQAVTTLDAQGRVVKVAIAGLDPIQVTYNAAGRPDSIAQGTRTYTLTYDAQGHVAGVEDPLGHTTTLSHDLAGRVTTQTLPDGSQIGYAYDANGNLTSLTPPGSASHNFTYTADGRVAQYTPPDIGPGTEATSYAYNLDGQLDLVTRPDGLTLVPAYDSAGRLSTLTLPDRTVSYVYASPNDPAAGQLTQVNTSDGVDLTYAYDGNLLTDTTWAGPVAGTVHRGYDDNFRVVSESVDNGPAVNFAFDDDGLLTQAGALSLSHDAQNGLLTGTSLGSLTDAFTYNSFAEETSYAATYAGSAKLTVQLTRDALGRVVQRTESVDGGTSHTYTYQYDLTGDLTDVSEDGSSIAHYVYDANGNRLSYTGPGGTLTGTYDNQDRLVSYGGATYTYTANGELQSKTLGGQTTSYQYDVLGNLTKVVLPDGTQIEYAIDGQGRRVGKMVNGSLIQGFLYRDGLEPVAVLDGSGNVVAEFVYGSRSNVPDYLIKNGVTYRIFSDQLGSPRLVVDVATGTVAQRIDYDEFGHVTLDTNPGFQPFGFAGGLYDTDTGLVRFGVRDYDAQTGRWTAKDPTRFAGGDTNLYGYVHNDPLNSTDPTGQKPVGPIYMSGTSGRTVWHTVGAVVIKIWELLTGNTDTGPVPMGQKEKDPQEVVDETQTQDPKPAAEGGPDPSPACEGSGANGSPKPAPRSPTDSEVVKFLLFDGPSDSTVPAPGPKDFPTWLSDNALAISFGVTFGALAYLGGAGAVAEL
jgi:RHS repeat-associated protein